MIRKNNFECLHNAGSRLEGERIVIEELRKGGFNSAQQHMDEIKTLITPSNVKIIV